MTLDLTQPAAHSIPGNSAQDALMLGACCTALATLVPVMLFQIGIVDSLPDPPVPLFDSEKITSSKMAHPLGIPDSLPGLASFGVTLALILLARRSPVARRLLGAKLVVDGGAAAFNATRQVIGFGKLCSWCTGTALAAGVMVYAGRKVIAETAAEAKSLEHGAR